MMMSTSINQYEKSTPERKREREKERKEEREGLHIELELLLLCMNPMDTDAETTGHLQMNRIIIKSNRKNLFELNVKSTRDIQYHWYSLLVSLFAASETDSDPV